MGDPCPWVKVPKGTAFRMPGVAVGATGVERIVSRLEGKTTSVHWIVSWVTTDQAPPSQGSLAASFTWNVYAVAEDQRIVKGTATGATAQPGTVTDIFVHGQAADAWELGVSMTNPSASSQAANVWQANISGIAYGEESS